MQVKDSPLLLQQIEALQLSVKHLKNENNRLKVRRGQRLALQRGARLGVGTGCCCARHLAAGTVLPPARAGSLGEEAADAALRRGGSSAGSPARTRGHRPRSCAGLAAPGAGVVSLPSLIAVVRVLADGA